MDKKDIAKRYLISAALLYFIGAAVIGIMLWALNRLSGRFDPGAGELILISLLCPLLPLGSFTGFVAFGTRVKGIKTKTAWLLIVFYPVLLVFITVSGIVLIIPCTVKSVISLIRG
ncbi:MAG: hypothetical protein K6C14_08020 [Eubacterium sp.]|nr:hypothetical protein [Eubacterium sp.]